MHWPPLSFDCKVLHAISNQQLRGNHTRKGKESTLGNGFSLTQEHRKLYTFDNINAKVYSFEFLNKPFERKGFSVDLDEC